LPYLAEGEGRSVRVDDGLGEKEGLPTPKEGEEGTTEGRVESCPLRRKSGIKRPAELSNGKVG